MDDLGAANTIVNLDIGRRAPLVAHRGRQGLTRRNALLQLTKIVIADAAGHLPVGRRRREADRGTMSCHRGQQGIRRQPFEQHGAGARPHRETQQPAKTEGKRQRRRADEHIARIRAQAMTWKYLAHRHDVAVCVDTTFRDAGGSRGKCYQGRVVGGRIDGGETIRLVREPRLELGIAVIHDRA